MDKPNEVVIYIIPGGYAGSLKSADSSRGGQIAADLSELVSKINSHFSGVAGKVYVSTEANGYTALMQKRTLDSEEMTELLKSLNKPYAPGDAKYIEYKS